MATLETKTTHILDAHRVAYRVLPHAAPVFTVAACARVNISRGDPWAGLELDPQDLIRITGARLAAIAEAS